MNTQNTYQNPREHKFTKDGYGPIFYENSKVLILGSFPSESSEEAGFYYGDSRNRFWFILGTLFNKPNLQSIVKSMPKNERMDFLKEFLRDTKIALWDIWASCYKKNPKSGSDSGIIADKSQYVDLTELFEKVKIKKIFTTIGGSEMSKNESDRRGGRFKEWNIEKWLWDNYSKYFSHCKNPSEMVTPLFSTSSISPYANNKAKKMGCPELLADYRQIKEIVES